MLRFAPKRQAGIKKIDRTLRMPGLDAMGQTEIPSKIAGMRHTFAEYTATGRGIDNSTPFFLPLVLPAAQDAKTMSTMPPRRPCGSRTAGWLFEDSC